MRDFPPHMTGHLSIFVGCCEKCENSATSVKKTRPTRAKILPGCTIACCHLLADQGTATLSDWLVKHNAGR